jgi:ABC-type polysaccharide/polyol phosphate export permease
LFGLFIGYVFNNRQLAILVSTFSAIGLFLVSNILLPLELMPKFFSYFVQYNPVVIGIEFLRQIFYYPNYNINLLDFLFLYFYIFILFSLLRYAYKKRKENFNN